MDNRINSTSGKKIQALFSYNHGSYKGLLLHKKWKEKRKFILKKDNYKCKCCGNSNELQVHHRQYHYSLKLRKHRKPWEYPNSLLVTLCKKCHQNGHQKFKVPTIYI